MKILVTGAAGFIGAALVAKLCEGGHSVVGIDTVNSYYDPRIKIARLERCGIKIPMDAEKITEIPASGSSREPVTFPDIPRGVRMESATLDGYTFIRGDICDENFIDSLFATEGFDAVVNLAAQAGVRYSLENPRSYIRNNVEGFLNLLEAVRRRPVKHFVYASSSSVYGTNNKVPFGEEDRVDAPESLYAATKRSDELMAHVYNRLYRIPVTGLRFFTVYGPWGRPDMAPVLFADAILHGRPIKVFNGGDMQRDFTYIDDIVAGVVKVLEKLPGEDVTARVYNIGCGSPTRLTDFISELENALGRKAGKVMMPMQPGDVKTTFADTSALEKDYGYRPATMLPQGIRRFAEWYLKHYQ